jgi:hypothetical protein
VVLGDSNAHQSGCIPQCTVFATPVAIALEEALGQNVNVVNLAWELSNPRPAQVTDIVEFVKRNPAAREALSAASAVLIFVSQNDLAYNRWDDPCHVAPSYPRIRWDQLTHDCMDAAVAQYGQALDALLTEIDTVRAGRPTMLRVVTAINTAPGTWSTRRGTRRRLSSPRHTT